MTRLYVASFQEDPHRRSIQTWDGDLTRRLNKFPQIPLCFIEQNEMYILPLVEGLLMKRGPQPIFVPLDSWNYEKNLIKFYKDVRGQEILQVLLTVSYDDFSSKLRDKGYQIELLEF